MDRLLPAEIITQILNYMSITDLVRFERTCSLFQSYALREIERRVAQSSDEWGVLIHLGQANAKLTRFDSITKKAYYSIQMDPVKIKTMFDHRRSIHCSLLRRKTSKYQSYNQNGFIISVEKGMQEGKTLELDVENDSCQVHAALTRQAIDQSVKPLSDTNLKKDVQPIMSMAPPPITYTLQITELSLPLSTLAA